MSIVKLLIDYGNTGFLYCFTVATNNEKRLFSLLKKYSRDVRFLERKKEINPKFDKGHRVLPDGSVILNASAFGELASANTQFAKSEGRMNIIEKAVVV